MATQGSLEQDVKGKGFLRISLEKIWARISST